VFERGFDLQLDQIRIFVGSPSDVGAERQIVKDIIDEYNSISGPTNRAVCKFIGWESDTFSAMGVDGQEVINTQIDDNFDIFIGIMWSKVGTATARAASGTIEEFERALSRWQTDPNSVNVGFYFKTDAIPQDILDPEQYLQVRDFKSKIHESGCLTKDFSGDSFEKLFRRELNSNVADFLTKLRKKKDVVGTGSSKESSTKLIINDSEALTEAEESELRPTDNGEEPYLLDLREQLDDSFERVNEISNLFAREIANLGAKMSSLSDRISSLSKNGPPTTKDIKKIVNENADDLDQFSLVVEMSLPDYERHFSKAVDSVTGIQLILLNSDEDNDAVMSENITGMDELLESLIEAKSGVTVFREAMDKLPSLSGYHSKAKKRLLQNMHKLDENFGNSISEIKAVISKFRKP